VDLLFFNLLVCGRLYCVTLVFVSSSAFAGTMDINLGRVGNCLCLYLFM